MYPDYEGPFKGMLSRYCWMCGEENPPIILSLDDQKLGCCEKHSRVLKETAFTRRDAGTKPKQRIRIAGHEVDW
jgi:hypothetical protein